MIKFHAEETSEEREPRFGDVRNSQFFIDKDGYLCQKIDDDSFQNIANEQGSPVAFSENDADPNTIIQKILPKVTKITWDE